MSPSNDPRINILTQVRIQQRRYTYRYKIRQEMTHKLCVSNIVVNISYSQTTKFAGYRNIRAALSRGQSVNV